jgi:hypothetical protein
MHSPRGSRYIAGKMPDRVYERFTEFFHRLRYGECTLLSFFWLPRCDGD